MADVFVSYSRRDSEFVRRLADSVSELGREVWVDTAGIADAEVFPEAIKRAIEQSDAFLFVITPASASSTYCEQEVQYARELRKRIVPVLRDPVGDDELPAEIRDRNWIPFTEADEFDASLARLLTALDTDLEAAKAHTRWLVKALEWEGERRDRSFLLHGSELRAAEAWLAASEQTADPAPTALQREYLLASRESAARRQRLLAGASLTVAIVAIGLLVFALISRSQAVSEAVSAQAQALAERSQVELPDDPEIALILGVRAVREKATPQSLFALRAAIDAAPLQRAYTTVVSPGACGLQSGLSAALSPDGTQIAEGTCEGELRVVDAATGRVVWFEHVAAQVATLAYSPGGSLLAVGTDTRILLVNADSGAIVHARNAMTSGGAVFSGPGPGISSLAFSPDGRELAAVDATGVALWSVPALQGRQLSNDPVAGGGMVFTRDGRKLVVGGAYDNAFDVYALPSGHIVRRIVAPGPGALGLDILALSPDGRELAVGYVADGVDGRVSIYSTRTWVKQFDLTTIDDVGISALAFSPDGTRIAVGAADGTAGVWSLPAREQLVAYDGPTAAVTAMDFTAGGRSVLTASNDGTVRLWRAVGVEQAFIPLAASIQAASVTPGLVSVAAGTDGVLWLYGFRLPSGAPLGRLAVGPLATTGTVLAADARTAVGYALPNEMTGMPVRGPLRVLSVAMRRVVRTLPSVGVFQAALSPDGSRLFLRVQAGGPPNGIGRAEVVTVATGHTVVLQTATPCGYFPSDIAFADDDERIAGGSFCGIADVWDARTGRLLRQVNEGGQISGVDLSPDGSRLLVGSWDSRATIWPVAGGPPVVELIGHTRGINDAVFAARGSLVVTSALDDTVRVWDARTDQQLRVLDFAHFQGAVAVSPEGDQFAVAENATAAGADDVVRVFDTCPACEDAKALLKLAAPHVTSQLTTLERTVVDGG